jgi:hypothetical protein
MNTITKETWQCPHCPHSLNYDPAYIDVVNLAKVRHLLENHRMSIFEILDYDKKLIYAMNEFFNSSVLTYRNQLEDVF